MAEYKGSSSDGQRQKTLEKERMKMLSEFEQKRNKIIKENTVNISTEKFISQTENYETEFKNSTVGLIHLEDFKRIKSELENKKAREAALTAELKSLKPKKKKKLTTSSTLSFNLEEESDIPQELNHKTKKIGKDPNVDTSFLPDRDREAQERIEREKLRLEWLENQENIKNETITVTYSFWDGSGRRKEVDCKKGDTISAFLEKCRLQHRELRGVSVDKLMYVKEDIIIPHHYTFYDFIINKARGKSGPLFSFDVHDDLRLVNDATIEKDESHAGKVMERSWYQSNKHIFPANRWEVFDPEKNYGNYTVRDKKKV